MEPTIETDVIIGAGPTGLSLASQFIRYGTDFVIIEKNEGVTSYSKAVGGQARTLEILTKSVWPKGSRPGHSFRKSASDD